MRPTALITLILMVGVSAQAQACPRDDAGDPVEASEADNPIVLHGTIVYHDELRQWIGLRLDNPVCEQSEIQLVFSKHDDLRNAESFRDCTVIVSGTLYDSPTGYYSADVAISDPKIEPDPTCEPHPIKPDPYAAPVRPDLDIFHASITVDYRGKGHVDVQVWQDDDAHSQLEPWQAYVHYGLTGSAEVVWFGCRENFEPADIAQFPKPLREPLDDDGLVCSSFLNLDGKNTLTFTCRRRAVLPPAPDDAGGDDSRSVTSPNARALVWEPHPQANSNFVEAGQRVVDARPSSRTQSSELRASH